MIKKRLLRAILNSGVSTWKEFSYDQKKLAILEVTPYDYNTKYALVQLPSLEIPDNVVTLDLDIKGNFLDLGVVFVVDSDLTKLSINDGIAHLQTVDIKKSPILVIGRGNTKQEIESVKQLSIASHTVLTPIVGVKFKASIPTITLGLKNAQEDAVGDDIKEEVKNLEFPIEE